jgi:hypothetical protein
VIVQTTVNAITILHDDARVARWKPFVWEYTSAALTIPLIFAVAWLARFAPPSRSGWLKFAAVHIPASLLYCAIHVSGFTLLRKLIYLAARSAGNYVEVHLVDGRKPMLRGTLASVETALKPHGFVRTHRSWLVNPLRVRELTAEGSGDFRVGLDGGAEAPVSRRFPQALETLKSPQANA